MNRWADRVAARAKRFHPSVCIDYDALPGDAAQWIAFTGGTPPRECLPTTALLTALNAAWDAEPEALWYGDPQGYEPLREQIARLLAERGVCLSAEEVLITNGAQQAIDVLARLLLEPGDRVLVEGPTYFGALQVFEPYDVQIEAIPLDEYGIRLDMLEDALARQPRPKLLYLVPTFQNPTGVTLTAERRVELVALADHYGVAVIEDDPYGELWFDAPPPPPLRAYHPDVFFVGTFSKSIAPGLRIGWLVAPRELIGTLTDIKESIDCQADRLHQRAIARLLAVGWYTAHVASVRPVYRRRCQMLERALAEQLTGWARWTMPGGGVFLWLELPQNTDTDALLPKCAEAGVVYVPGSAFFTERTPQPSMRLGFSTLPEEQIVPGVERLASVVRAHVRPSLVS